MAVSETDTSDCNSDSSADGLKQGERKERPFTKAIIRRLPPSMNKETFLTQVAPVPEYDYLYFVKADMSLGENSFARAYINFKNTPDIFIFKEKFDNYVFLDAKGNEYTAVVEFAPFSRIPKKRNKSRSDPKVGTIETDPMYTDFVESLTVTLNENEEKPEYCFQPSVEEEKKNINTPLLDFIKQRRIDRQKIREEKREDRKRKELERKKFKEEERRRRSKNDTSSYSAGKSSSKNIQILNASKETLNTHSDERSKEEMSSKLKDRKADNECRYKSSMKDDRKPFPYQKTNKDARKTLDQDLLKKSPSKIRQRNNDRLDAKSKPDSKFRRDENFKTRKPNEYYKDNMQEDPRIMEKKVKKYSERREERKNEIKKLETQKSGDDYVKQSSLEVDKEDDDKKNDTKMGKEYKDIDCKQSECSDDYNDGDENGKGSKENDPRTQRRIRNKDRPSMAIYQPGRGLGRGQQKKADNLDVKSDNIDVRSDNIDVRSDIVDLRSDILDVRSDIADVISDNIDVKADSS